MNNRRILVWRAEVAGHKLLDLSNGKAWIQTLWTNGSTVHNSVASVHRVVVIELLQTLLAELISRVNNPS